MSQAAALPPLLWSFCAALGGGLLIGLERERRKGRGPTRHAAGVRSFATVCGMGALAQSLGQPALVAVGAAGVVLLAVLSHWRSLQARDPDPGMTTEVALVATYLIGVLAVDSAALGAGAAVVLSGLLALRSALHRFSTRLISDGELHDGLLLAALALVLLPLLPGDAQPWLGGAAPRTLVGLVVLLLSVQAAGHVALRLLGHRRGLAVAGLLGGLVSSTATVASMGARARAASSARTDSVAALAGAATLSAVATWGLAGALMATLAPALARALLGPLLAGAVTALVLGAWHPRPTQPRDATEAGPTSWSAALDTGTRGPLRVRDAALVALLLTAVTLAAGWARAHLGQAGVLATVVLAALADAHAGIAAVGAMARGGALTPSAAAVAVLAATATNTVTRSVVALASGGRAYGLRVALGLSASLAAAVATAIVLGTI